MTVKLGQIGASPMYKFRQISSVVLASASLGLAGCGGDSGVGPNSTPSSLDQVFREMSLPAISRHLKVLEHAGLIARGREAQWRPCRLEGERLKEAANWLEEYRRFWEQSLDRLDAYLQVLQAKDAKKGRARRRTISRRTPK